MVDTSATLLHVNFDKQAQWHHYADNIAYSICNKLELIHCIQIDAERYRKQTVCYGLSDQL